MENAKQSKPPMILDEIKDFLPPQILADFEALRKMKSDEPQPEADRNLETQGD